jgi:hypothetical protein
MVFGSPMTRTGDIVDRLREANSEIGRLIDRLGSSPTPAEYLEARAQIGRLQAGFDKANNALSLQLGISSARERILEYLRAHVGEVVTKEEIAGVAGIFEFQRRIRELRCDEGWLISSMESHPELRPGHYMLLSSERDLSRTSQWDIARKIRASAAPLEAKLLELLSVVGGQADLDLIRLALGVHDVEKVVISARADGAILTSSSDSIRLAQ